MEQNFKDTFSELIESLKRSQRAELVDEENNSVLEELYVDPFEGNMVINNMMNDQTTLLIGRKGTGKSTIINKFQHEIRKSSNKAQLRGAYLHSHLFQHFPTSSFLRSFIRVYKTTR